MFKSLMLVVTLPVTCAALADGNLRPLCVKLVCEGLLGGMLYATVKVADLWVRHGDRLTARRAKNVFAHECGVGLVAGLLTATLLSLVVLCGK
jgi:hypothetical protein